ncbi:MAG: acyl-CoA thioesterase II, partial [Actinomycetales bacterium]|nr:acyl-CoA thioesterase II [Actinomycetales bacterium]
MAPAPSDPVAALLAALDLAQEGPDTFTGGSLPQLNGRVFGGQVLAQSILAAGRTLEDARLPHSMHGYFLRPGRLDEPITFQVERLRDGRSFSARRTHAIQGGKPILSMIASFQEEQPGIEFAEAMPDVPAPDEVTSAHEELG